VDVGAHRLCLGDREPHLLDLDRPSPGVVEADLNDRVVGDPEVAVLDVRPEVRAVDATGAGDCFNGVFAAGLLEGLDPAIAVRRAVMAASISVTRAGAREGMPSRADIDAALD